MEPAKISVHVELSPQVNLTFQATLKETREDYEVLFPKKIWRVLENFKRGEIKKLKLAVIK